MAAIEIPYALQEPIPPFVLKGQTPVKYRPTAKTDPLRTKMKKILARVKLSAADKRKLKTLKAAAQTKFRLEKASEKSRKEYHKLKGQIDRLNKEARAKYIEKMTKKREKQERDRVRKLEKYLAEAQRQVRQAAREGRSFAEHAQPIEQFDQRQADHEAMLNEVRERERQRIQEMRDLSDDDDIFVQNNLDRLLAPIEQVTDEMIAAEHDRMHQFDPVAPPNILRHREPQQWVLVEQINRAHWKNKLGTANYIRNSEYINMRDYERISARDEVGRNDVLQQLKRDDNFIIRDIVELIMREKEEFGACKFVLNAFVRYIRMDRGTAQKYDAVFRHNVIPVMVSDTVESVTNKVHYVAGLLDTDVEEFQGIGSGHRMVQTFSLKLDIDQYSPVRGAGYIKVPKWVSSKRCVTNPFNGATKKKDGNEKPCTHDPEAKYCFKWAVMAAVGEIINEKENLTIMQKRHLIQHIKTCYNRMIEAHPERAVDFDCIEYPAPLEYATFEKFEKANPHIGLNIIEVPEKSSKPLQGLAPVWATPKEYTDQTIEVNLLYVYKGQYEDGHYANIHNMRGLLRSSGHGKEFPCTRCLRVFTSEKLFKHHKELCRGCGTNTGPRIDMPREGSTIEFTNYTARVKEPLVMFYDIESILAEVERPDDLNEDGSYSINTHTHVPCGYCYVVLDEHSNVLHREVYRGKDCMLVMVKSMLEKAKEYGRDLQRYPEPNLTDEQEAAFQAAERCWLCQKQFEDDDVRVRDHDHYTGAYRGAAHNECNVNCKTRQEISVFAHNAANYDLHALACELSRLDPKVHGEPQLVPLNHEKYISLRIGKGTKLNFKDSTQFLMASLDKLVNTVTANDAADHFVVTQDMADRMGVPLELFTKKGIYPYEYMNHFDRFDETELPPKEAFFSKLTDSGIDDEEYEHAQKVWKDCGCETMGDYHDMYLELDVCLLADVFQHFRNIFYDAHGLDPYRYITIPGFSFDVAKYRFANEEETEVELITDENMYLKLEQSIRGGLTQAVLRHAEANNPLCPPGMYDPSKPKTWLEYNDANSLYPSAMVQSLPYADYKWATQDELRNTWTLENIMQMGADDEVGCFVECDFEYPPELHDKLADFPPCPEVMNVDAEWLSPKQKELLHGEKYVSTPKLVANLLPKKDYLMHYRVFQFCVKLGINITKIGRVISFKQKKWLKRFVDINTQMRINARTKFEKDVLKLLSNSAYGKLIQNPRKERDLALMHPTSKRLKKWVGTPRYKGRNIIRSAIEEDKKMVSIEREKNHCLMDKPIAAGFAVLELSKLIMLEFWYNTLKPRYGDKIEYVYGDTDSIIYKVETEDLYADIGKGDTADSIWDTSGFPKFHKCYSPVNHKVLGKFSDETDGLVIYRIACTRAKSYAYQTYDPYPEHEYENEEDRYGEGKRLKGIKTGVVKKKLRYEHYEACVLNGETRYDTQVQFRSHKHRVTTMENKKKSLAAFDSKRYLCADGVRTLPWGHKDIP